MISFNTIVRAVGTEGTPTKHSLISMDRIDGYEPSDGSSNLSESAKVNYHKSGKIKKPPFSKFFDGVRPSSKESIICENQ